MLSVVLITRNHPEYVKRILESPCSLNQHCDYLILDSSNDDCSREIESLAAGSVWAYEHLDTKLTTDEKILNLLGNFKGNYLWMIGDGVIPDLESLWPWLSQRLEEHPDCIHLVNRDARNCRHFFTENGLAEEFMTDDIVTACSDFFWSATFLGALIISRNLAGQMLACERLNSYLNTGFAVPCLVFDSLEANHGKMLISLRHYYLPNPKKQLSVWIREGRVFEIWSKDFPEAIQALPEAFDLVKEEIIRTVCRRNEYYSLRYMFRWRGMGILNKDSLAEHREELLFMSRLSPHTLDNLSKMPKWLCRFGYMPFELRNQFKHARYR